MKTFLILLCAALLLNTIRLGQINFGGNNFLLSLGFLAAACCYTLFFERLKNLKWLTYAIFICFAGTVAAGIFVVQYGQRDTAQFNEDAVIILGAAVIGETPSRALQRRLDTAVEYFNRNPDAFFITTGGLGNLAYITEAEAMARFLILNGVPEEHIFLEGASHSTYQNLTNALEILDELFADRSYSITIISNDFHIFRATRHAARAGIENITHKHATTPIDTIPGNLVRELAAIVLQLP